MNTLNIEKLKNETSFDETTRILLEPHNEGEYELKAFLRANGIKVYDVSDNPLYWKKDIDILIGDNYSTSIEIKWDSRIAATGNLFIELCSDLNTYKDGWYKFCEADYLAYGDSKNEVFYFFDFKELKQYIDSHRSDFQMINAPDYGRDGVYKYSMGLLVPLSEIENLSKKVCLNTNLVA